MTDPKTRKLLLDVFLYVAKHLFTQKRRSVRKYRHGEGSCRYRGLNGLKCAVGCLIPDELYRVGLEGMRAHDPALLEAIRFNGLSGTDLPREVVDLLGGLQEIHDASDPVTWPRGLNRLARSFDIPVQFATV